MGVAWGYAQTSAAALASLMSLAGMAGSIIFGLVSDRIGGARTVALIAFDNLILWSLLLVDLPYAARAIVIGLMGMHGSGAVPAISKAMASAFGEASFSRAFGLVSAATLPLTIGGVFGFGVIFQMQSSYTTGMVSMIASFAIAIPLAILAGRRVPNPPQ
jgi:MFS family permease